MEITINLTEQTIKKLNIMRMTKHGTESYQWIIEWLIHEKARQLGIKRVNTQNRILQKIQIKEETKPRKEEG